MNPEVLVQSPSECQYSVKLDRMHMAYSSLNPSRVGTLIPDQLKMTAVTGACKLIDGCSLELCSYAPSVAASGICHTHKKSTQFHESMEGPAGKDSITIHYILSRTQIQNDLHVIRECFVTDVV